MHGLRRTSRANPQHQEREARERNQHAVRETAAVDRAPCGIDALQASGQRAKVVRDCVHERTCAAFAMAARAAA